MELGSEAQAVPWSSFRRLLRDSWQPGEHLSLLAPTGGGKTTLAIRGLLPIWRYVVALDVKGDDRSLAGFGKAVHKFPARRPFGGYAEERYRVIAKDRRRGPVIMAEALDRMYEDGRWTAYLDETRILTDPRYYGLGSRVEALWLYGRSRGLTLVAATQAPRYVPSAFYDQARHHVLFQVRDRRAVRRLAEIGGHTDVIERIVPYLRPHEFLYIGPDQTMLRSRYPLSAAA